MMTAALWLASHLIEAEGGSDNGSSSAVAALEGKDINQRSGKLGKPDNPGDSNRMQSSRKGYRARPLRSAAVRRKSAWRASMTALCKSGAKGGTMNCDACGDLEDGNDRMLNLLDIA